MVRAKKDGVTDVLLLRRGELLAVGDRGAPFTVQALVDILYARGGFVFDGKDIELLNCGEGCPPAPGKRYRETRSFVDASAILVSLPRFSGVYPDVQRDNFAVNIEELLIVGPQHGAAGTHSYRLRACVLHDPRGKRGFAALQSGHYTACVRAVEDNGWRLCDDAAKPARHSLRQMCGVARNHVTLLLYTRE